MPRKSPKFYVLLAIAATFAAFLAISGGARADVYTYDAHGRLTKVTFSDGSYIEYHYDEAGNRTAVQGTAP